MSAEKQLPITVIIPTWNEMGQIQGHLNNLSEWLDCVREVIVVDSQSDDGTLEYIQENLQHPNLKIETRPRGLYAAWNYAVKTATSKYINFATVGDRVPKETIFELYENAEKFDADICLSAPDFYDTDGRLIDHKWPVHDYIDHFNVRKAEMISADRCVAWNTAFFPRTLIGSSASNLYSREMLLAAPFPVDFGHAGDSVFAYARSFSARWVIVPDGDSHFICHEKKQKSSGRLKSRFFKQGMRLLQENRSGEMPAQLHSRLCRLLEVRRRLMVIKRMMKRMRGRKNSGNRFRKLGMRLEKRYLTHQNKRLRRIVLANL